MKLTGHTLPKLYKKTSTGATQTWLVEYDGSAYRTLYGQEGGKLTVSEWTECVGKQGRTDEQQAEFEAQALWTKKLKAGGYVQSISDAKHGAASSLVGGGRWPMLAKRFDKDGGKIKYPAHCQPKLDGLRCIAMVENGKCSLWSRTRKPITGVPHIARAFEELGVDFVADGELYHSDYHDKFDQLVHFVRQTTPADGHEIVQFHCYDIVMDGTFEQRLKFLDSLALKEPLVPVDTIVVSDEDDVMLAFERFRQEKFEGCMVRNSAGLYLSHPSHRSDDLQKVKEMQDEDFVVVRVKEGKGKMTGRAVFVIETKPGVTTDAKMKGKLSDLRQYWDHPETAIGRKLMVQFQGWQKDGKLRFPVAIRFVDPL